MKEKNKETLHLGEIMDMLLQKAKGTFLNQVKEKMCLALFCAAPHVEGTYQPSHPEAKCVKTGVACVSGP